MFPSVLPMQGPLTPAHGLPALEDAHHRAALSTSWFEQNFSTWLGVGLRILLILVIAVVLRSLIRRAITRFIDRMNRTVQAVDGTALGGLLVTQIKSK